jgi:hypothetical protein
MVESRADGDAGRGERLSQALRHRDPLGGHAAAVLDPVEPGGQAHLDRRDGVGVPSHRQAGTVGLVDQAA